MALFIGRLPTDCRPRELESIFTKYGRLTRCDIKRGGYGFVEYEDPRDAEDAIKGCDGMRFLGERIVVEWAKGTKKATSEECFKCGKTGHYARSCPVLENGQGRRSGRSRSRSNDRSYRPRDRDVGRDRDYDRRDRDAGRDRDRDYGREREQRGRQRDDRDEYTRRDQRSPKRDEYSRRDQRSPKRDALSPLPPASAVEDKKNQSPIHQERSVSRSPSQ